MTYRIIRMIDGAMKATETADIGYWAQQNGVRVLHLNRNPRQRAELQGEPVLAGFLGPMWDGDAIRYEDSESNERLSI